MSSPSKRKGMAAERQVLALFQAHGVWAIRHLSSEQAGGHALCDIETDIHAVEVKYRGTGARPVFDDSWWMQVGKAATALYKKPMIAYRFARQPWRARFHSPSLQAWVDVRLEDWLRTGMRL